MNAITTIRGHGTSCQVHSIDGKRWVSASHLATRIGLSPTAFRDLLARYRHQFEEGVETILLPSKTGRRGAWQERWLSPRAALKVVRHARTQEADRMFDLLLDYVEGKQRRKAQTISAPSEPAQQMLTFMGSGEAWGVSATDVCSGRATLPVGAVWQPALIEMADGDRLMAQGMAAYRRGLSKARAIGGRRGELKLIRTALKSAVSAPHHGALIPDGGEAA